MTDHSLTPSQEQELRHMAQRMLQQDASLALIALQLGMFTFADGTQSSEVSFQKRVQVAREEMDKVTNQKGVQV
jgi:hypothetical protein